MPSVNSNLTADTSFLLTKTNIYHKKCHVYIPNRTLNDNGAKIEIYMSRNQCMINEWHVNDWVPSYNDCRYTYRYTNRNTSAVSGKKSENTEMTELLRLRSCANYCKSRAWYKTIVTPYIKWGSYNSFEPSPRNTHTFWKKSHYILNYFLWPWKVEVNVICE